MSTPILVLGMHRSGTSAVAGALSRLGVVMGDRVRHEVEDTAIGYYEHHDVVAMHDELALRVGRTWDDPRPAAPELHAAAMRAQLGAAAKQWVTRDFAGVALWAVKDPRLCRTLPAWFDGFDADGVEARCLLVLRSPADVAASLAQRDGFSNEKSAALWLDHVLEAHRCSRGRRRTRVFFDELLQDAPAILDRCGAELEVRWPHPPGSRREILRDFLRPENRHHREVRWGEAPGALAELASAVWSEMHDNSDWLPAEKIDAWYRDYAERFAPSTALVFEHATQVAERISRDRAWSNTNQLRQEVADSVSQSEVRISEAIGSLARESSAHAEALEARISEVIGGLAGELSAHSEELVKQGDAITQGARKLKRIEDTSVTHWVGAAIRRLFGSSG